MDRKEIISKLSPQEKTELLTGRDFWSTAEHKDKGMRRCICRGKRRPLRELCLRSFEIAVIGDFAFGPCYPFGYGLSYTKFESSKLTISEKEISFDVKNVGDLTGKEIAPFYFGKKESGIKRPKRQLCALINVYTKKSVPQYIMTKGISRISTKAKTVENRVGRMRNRSEGIVRGHKA